MSDQEDPRQAEAEHREEVKGIAGCPVIDPQELLDVGYVAEANRRFFHPLGLALAVDPTSGRVTVLDSRDDPEGWIFSGEEGDALHDELLSKRDRVRDLEEERRPVRVAALGYWIQPLDGLDVVEVGP